MFGRQTRKTIPVFCSSSAIEPSLIQNHTGLFKLLLRTAVSPPATLVCFGADRSFFAIRNGSELHAAGDFFEITFGSTRATFTQRHVVLIGTAFVAVTLKQHALVALLDTLAVFVQRGPRVAAQRRFIEIEVNGLQRARGCDTAPIDAFFAARAVGIAAALHIRYTLATFADLSWRTILIGTAPVTTLTKIAAGNFVTTSARAIEIRRAASLRALAYKPLAAVFACVARAAMGVVGAIPTEFVHAVLPLFCAVFIGCTVRVFRSASCSKQQEYQPAKRE